MKNIFTILFLLFSFKNFAQENNLFKNAYVYITPSTLIEPKAIIRMGIGKDFKNNGVLLEMGYGKNNNKIDYTRFQYRILCRHYFFKNEENTVKPYVFLDMFYNNTKILINNGSYRIEDFKNSTSIYMDSFQHITFDRGTSKINKIGGNVGLGVLTKISKHIYLDTYLGMGIASLKLNYTDLLNPQIKYLPYQGAREWADLERFSLPKTMPVFSMKLGISLVYKIN